MQEGFGSTPEFQKSPENNEKRNISEKIEKAVDKILLWGSIAAVTGAAGLGIKIFHEHREARKPENYIEYISTKGELNESQRNELLNQLKYLKEQFSDNIIPHLKQSDIRAQEKVPPVPHIEGFQESNVPTQDLQKLWNDKMYPKGTIEGNVEYISYRGPSEVREDSEYGFRHVRSGEADNRDYAISLMGWLESDLKGISYKDRIESLDWIFSHELGHLNDWDSARGLTPEQRVQFLDEVTRAYEREGKFKGLTGYDDKINNPDAKKEKYYKVSEWWGTLSEYYFTFPDILREDSPQDYKLAHKWLSRNDTNFNPALSKVHRDVVIEEIVKKQE